METSGQLQAPAALATEKKQCTHNRLLMGVGVGGGSLSGPL